MKNRDGRDRSRSTPSPWPQRLARPLCAGAVLLAVLTLAGPAGAQEGEPTAPPPASGGSSWSIKPSPTPEQPSRDLFALVGRPGQVLRDSIRVRTTGPASLVLTVYGTDAFITDKGAFDVRPASEEPRDLGRWITTGDDQITVAGDTTVDIPFTITIPATAAPGDHVGGLIASAIITDPAEGSATSTERRLGARVYLSLGGPTAAGVEITDLQAGYGHNWIPFANGVVTVTYTARNTGPVRLHARRRVEISGPGLSAAADVDLPELAPGASASFTHTVTGVSPTGRVTAAVHLSPRTTAQDELPTPPVVPVTAETTVWAVPWTVLALIAAAGSVLALWIRGRRQPRSFTFNDDDGFNDDAGWHDDGTDPSFTGTDLDLDFEDDLLLGDESGFGDDLDPGADLDPGHRVGPEPVAPFSGARGRLARRTPLLDADTEPGAGAGPHTEPGPGAPPTAGNGTGPI